jgi:hypothetical protein
MKRATVAAPARPQKAGKQIPVEAIINPKECFS